MFAGALNKGFRGALPFLIGLFLIAAIFSFFSVNIVENINYPNLFYNFFAQKVQSPLLITLINYVFVALGVLLVSLIGVNQEIVEKQNYFPVFMYLFLCLACVQPMQINPQIFTNVLIFYSFYKILDTYRQEEVLNNIFVSAFCLAVSAYIAISSVVNFPIFFITLIILRPFNWREWVVAFIGFIAPVFLYESIAYLSNFNQWYFLDASASFLHHFKIPSISEYYLPLLVILFVLLLISIFSAFVGGFGNTVKKQKAKSILLWYFFMISLTTFSEGNNGSRIILTNALPLCFLIGNFLFDIKQIKITNTILTLLMICLVIIFLAQYKLV